MSDDSYQEKCRQAGLKVTPQRMAVYKTLVGSTEHPSAETVFRQVRMIFPNILLDTVNRTLLMLSEIGAVFVVEGSGGSKRFDANLKPHHHFKCVKCKRIIDFYHEPFDDIEIPESISDKYEVYGKVVNLEGMCDKCLRKYLKKSNDWNFTNRTITVMLLADQKAREQNTEYIDTEHILLGLIDEGSGVGIKVLKHLNIDIMKLYIKTKKLLKSGSATIRDTLPQTPCAKKVIEYAKIESCILGHDHVGTEHILLGLLKETKGVASKILASLGLNLEQVRAVFSSD